MGMVKLPVPTTLATEEPETVPMRPEERTATFAGPPAAQPAIALAISIKNLPRPVDSRYAPKRINRKIKVDENYRTNVPGIYAIGDVIGGAMLAHVASDEGRVCVERICGLNTYVDYDIIPACVFAFPELASVGKTEEQLKAEDVKYNAARFAFSGNGKALSLGGIVFALAMLASYFLF